MNRNIVVSALVAALMACGASASAQDRHEQNERGPQQQDQRGDAARDHADNGRQRDDNGRGHADARPQHGDSHASNRGAGPRHDLHKGNRVPSEYRNKQHYVSDWRGRHLSAPPRGHQWVQVDGDYVLMAVATGVIAQIVLGN